jgi:ComF family protein
MRASLLNLIFPPQCLVCDTLVPEHGTLCAACWSQVPFATAPMCACCGLPLEFVVDETTLCGECLAEHPPYSRARSVFVYNDTSRALVLKLKYQDEQYLAQVFGRWLKNAGAELVAASDIIVPVPLHYWRMVRRRYNQSALIAKVLARETGLPAALDGLIRARHTPQQTGLTRAQRQKNVSGAFVVNPKKRDALKGKCVLLIDDVMTTGATLDACTKMLLKQGVAQVNVLTLARTTGA